MLKETQQILFPQKAGEVKSHETKPVDTARSLPKPKFIKGSEAFSRAEPTSIHPECLNKITREISYGNGVKYWRPECGRMINASVAHRRLGPDEAKEARTKIENYLETQYYNTMEFIEDNLKPRGSEFYIQKVLRYKDLREAKETTNLGLEALWESELTKDRYEKEALEFTGFTLLQVAHGIAQIRQGVLFRDPFPAYSSELQYKRKGDLNRKLNKLAKKAQEKTKLQHHAREDLWEFSIPYYQKRIEHWEKIFQALVPNHTDKYKEYKEIHDEEIRKAGGTPEFRVRKEKPQYFEDILRSSDQLAPYALYAFGLQALRNPFDFKRNGRRSEKAGFMLILKAFEKAGFDSSRTFNFKGFQAFALYSECLFKKGQTEPKGHALKKEIVRQIGISQAGRDGKKPMDMPKRRSNVGNDEEPPF